jgi:hypothetical protein
MASANNNPRASALLNTEDEMTCTNCGDSKITQGYCAEHAEEIGEIEENLHAEIASLKDAILLAITYLEDGAPKTALVRLNEAYTNAIQ